MTSQTLPAAKDRFVSPGEAIFLGFVLFCVALLVVAVLTQNTHLHSRFEDINWRVFEVAMPIWLVLLARAYWTARVRGPGASRHSGMLADACRTLLGAIALAGFTVLVMDYCLLLAVRFGQAQPVDFHSQVDSTWRGKGCAWGSFSFYNLPLHTPTSNCTDGLVVGGLKVGDPIIVRELVGDWGGTIVWVKREPR
jgi:hypothetical protein